MKKLLNLLGSFALFSSAATCTVACKSDKKDLKELTDNLTITSLKTADDFREKLIAKIKTESGFENVSATEIEILKKDGSVLDNNYIDGAKIEIKIKAKTDAEKLSGEKEVKITWSILNVTRKNLSSLTNPTIQSQATASAFKTALITAIQRQTGFATLDATKLEIKKDASGSAGDVLSDNTADNAYITGSTIKVHLSVKTAGSTEFEGTKTLTVNWTTPSSKKNLSSLTSPTIQSQATASAFKNALITAIQQQPGFATLDTNKLEIKKDANNSAGAVLSDNAADNAYITGSTIKVHLSVKTAGSTEFEGTKTLTVNWTTPSSKKNLSSLTNPTIQSQATASAFKTALITAIQQQPGFATLDTNKLEIKKDANNSAGAVLSDNAADNAYITGSTIKVHLSVKTAGSTEFEGTKTLTVNWTAPSSKKNLSSLTSPTIQSQATASAFKNALITAIQQQPGFATLDTNKLEIKKDANNSAGAALSDNAADNAYITGSTIKVHLSVKTAGSTEFEGTKTLTVNWTTPSSKKNLSSLTNPTIQSQATASAFKNALITAIQQQPGFATLDTNKLEIKKDANNSAGAVLSDNAADNAYITGSTIKVHLSVKSAGSTEFEGTKTLTVNWTAPLLSLNTLPDEIIVSANLNDITDFKNELVDVLNYGEFKNLTADKIQIQKSDGNTNSNLQVSDINAAGSVRVKISVEAAGSTEFEGYKVIIVNLTEKNTNEVDLDTLSDAVTNVTATSRNLIEFKSNLVEALKKVLIIILQT